MGIWTITYGGVEKSCADWGLTARPAISTRDRSPTKFTFRMAGAALENGVPFPFKAEVKIKQNRTYDSETETWSGSGFVFTGYQTSPVGEVDGRSQGVTLVFQDAIWLMQNTTFQQMWKVNASDGHGGVTTTDVPVSRCVLFLDIVTGVEQSIAWQLNEIISYAASCGIAIAAGDIDYTDWTMNYYHCRAVSCWDAVLKCLEPAPDAKVWVDGSTTPPTLHVRTRAALAALTPPTETGPGPITLPYRGSDAAGRRHFSSKGFTPRYDLVVPQVVLQYQTNNTVDGKQAPSFANDVYPASVGGVTGGQLPFAMVCPIDLAGTSSTTEFASLDCEPVACVGGSHADKRAWWASKRGGEEDKLADFRVRFGAETLDDATITDEAGNAVDLSAYPNRIVHGTYHDWMENGSTQIVAVRAKVKVKAKFAQYDVVGSTPAETDTNGNLVGRARAQDLSCQITLTNAPSGSRVFQNLSIDTNGAESPVTGLAQKIFNSRSTLDYDGDHEIMDPGLPNGDPATPPLVQLIGHWNVLNFSGGAAAWATANMTIAATDIDLVTNHVRIQVGPARHLQPQDWNSMLQYFRQRRTFILSSARSTGYGGAGGSVTMAKNTPDANTVAGLNVSQFDNVIADAPTS